MKILTLSDTHNQLIYKGLDTEKVDLILHSGDLTVYGYEHELKYEFEGLFWLSIKNGGCPVVVTPGNHDKFSEDFPVLWRELCDKYGVVSLIDEEKTILGKRFYGLPWCPGQKHWTWSSHRCNIRQKHAAIPEGLDVLITHCPPEGILDTVRELEGWDERKEYESPDVYYRFKSFGSPSLREHVARAKPKVHVFGHIHDSHGTRKIGDTLFVNAAICDEGYTASNKPIIIEV